MLFGDLDRSVAEELGNALQRYALLEQPNGERIAETVRMAVWNFRLGAELAERAAVIAGRGFELAIASPEIIPVFVKRKRFERLQDCRRKRHVHARSGFHAAEKNAIAGDAGGIEPGGVTDRETAILHNAEQHLEAVQVIGAKRLAVAGFD